MSKISMKYILFIILSLVCGTIFAQTKEITIISAYQPTISDAYKINQNPRIVDTVSEPIHFTYDIQPIVIPSKVDVTPIEPAKLVGEPIIKLYNNFLKIGFGNYTSPYGEFFANTLRSKKYSLGAHIKHFSSNGNINDYAYQGFSNNLAELYGKKFFSKYTLDGKVSYKRDVVHYYGYKPNDYADSLRPSKKEIKQAYSLISAEIGFSSNNSDSSHLNHSYRINYYYLFDNHSAGEHNAHFSADINKGFRLFKLTKRQVLGATLDINYFRTSTKGYILGNSLIKLQPYISTNFSSYHFYLGINATVEAGTISTMHLYPLAEFKIDIIPSFLDAYAGLKGEMQKNSFKSLSDENPFIISEAPLDFTNNKFHFYGGLNARFNGDISLNVNVSGIFMNNMPMFVTDTLSVPENKFTVIYDNATMIKAGAALSWIRYDNIHIMLSGNYNYYDMENEKKAWHKPMVDINLSADYSIKDKIIIRADFFSYLFTYARAYESAIVKSEKLKNIFDINLGVEYRYNKKLSAFVNFNNIAASRYYRWVNYPSQRFNVLGGITFGF